MRILNVSPWDTKTLRRIARAANRAVGVSYLKIRVVFVVQGAHTTKYKHGHNQRTVVIRLPALRGDEWIGLVRQQYGSTPNRPDALTCGQVAWAMSSGLKGVQDRHTVAMDVDVGAFVSATAPIWFEGGAALVPLEPPKPLPQPRDHARERYRRAVELQRAWQRKAKLAATKLKKLRVRIRYYEKILAGRGT